MKDKLFIALGKALKEAGVGIEFESRFEDRNFAIQRFQEHNEAVMAAFDSSRLLVFDIADGWAPLCEFLNVPVPAVEFPRSNTRHEFQQRFAVPPVNN